MYISEYLNRRINNENGEMIGHAIDFQISSRDSKPQIQALIARKDRLLFSIPWDVVSKMDRSGFYLSSTILRPYAEREEHILLGRDVLDKQIVDRQGMKVVRVNDLEVEEAGGKLYLKAVDVGLSGLLRRLYFERPLKWLSKTINRPIGTRQIPWAMVDTLGSRADPMKLKVTVDRLQKLHPADLADIVEGLDREERNVLFSSLDSEKAAETIVEVEQEELQASIIANLEPEKASDILEEMPPDDAADLLADLPVATAADLLERMEDEDAADVKELMQYPEDTAGGLMTTEYISLLESLTVDEAIEELRQQAPEAETIYYLYVVDSEEHLMGVLSLRQLIISPKQRPIREILKRDPALVQIGDKQERVAEVIEKYDLLAIPVVDDQNRLQGIVTVDDVMDLLMEDKARKRRMVG
jgi:magnesium transporter